MRTVESYLLHPMRWLDFIGSDLGTKEKVPRLALCHLTWGVIPTPKAAVYPLPLFVISRFSNLEMAFKTMSLFFEVFNHFGSLVK